MGRDHAAGARISDSGAFRSARVPKLNMRSISVAFRDICGRSGGGPSTPRQSPADPPGLNRAAGFAVAPLAVDPAAGERQLVGAAVILAQHLDRLVRRRV